LNLVDSSTECRLPVAPGLPAAIHEHLESFAANAALPPKVRFAADTALEELAQNLVDHSGARELRVQFSSTCALLRIELDDDGGPFNPFESDLPDVSVPVEERHLGGLGLLMVRKLMDGIDYQRRDGWNHLTLTKSMD
jgi:anti-sigma regulatory factor (Ser/Thr protein kinase)